MATINSVLSQNILDAFINSSPNPGSISPNDNLIELCNGLANAIIAYDPGGGGGAVASVNGYTGVVVLNKADIGLNNVDNTQQLPLSYLDIDTLLTANSDVKVPSQKAIKTYVDTGLSGKQNTLGFTPENITNKSTSLASPSNTTYPTTQAIANNVLYTWNNSTAYTQGQKFIFNSQPGFNSIYIVKLGQTLNTGESPLTHPQKVEKVNPFDNYRMRWVTGYAGGAVGARGILTLQNWLYDDVRDKYVIAGGTTSDNIVVCETTSLTDIHAGINNVNIGHDVQRVVYINNEYWAINTGVAGTLTITRVNATTNTVISTFTSTYTSTLSGGFFRVRNNKMYYATFQSTVTFFNLYEIDGVTLTTNLVINQTTASGFTYMTWWFDEVNGFITSTSNGTNTYRVYDINTFALLGTYSAVTFANTNNQIDTIYASDGNTYVLLPQSSVYGFRVLQINPLTGAPTQVRSVGYNLPAPNNPWQVLYDSSNPDWVFVYSNSGVAGVVYFVNVLTSEAVPIQTPLYYGTVPPNTLTQYRYVNKQLETYMWVSAAGVSTIRQIIRMDFR